MRFRIDQDGGIHEGRRKAAFVFSGERAAMGEPLYCTQVDKPQCAYFQDVVGFENVPPLMGYSSMNELAP
jgi:hypothetical protein